MILGGNRYGAEGAFIEPTILTGVTPEMTAYQEEIFGPVLTVYSVRSLDEAVELANATKYGLGGTVFGGNIEQAVALARRIETGMVYINRVNSIIPEYPFGGTKHSGYGREQAAEGIYEFVSPKLIVP